MLARKLTLVLIAVVLLTAAVLAAIASRQRFEEIERRQATRLTTLARATRVAVENMLKTGSLEELQAMVSSLEKPRDRNQISTKLLVVNQEAAAMIKPSFEPTQRLWSILLSDAALPRGRVELDGRLQARFLPLMGPDRGE